MRPGTLGRLLQTKRRSAGGARSENSAWVLVDVHGLLRWASCWTILTILLHEHVDEPCGRFVPFVTGPNWDINPLYLAYITLRVQL